MDPFMHEILQQPNDDTHVWRYIKPQWIDSFLEGNIFFSPLSLFEDYYESITPLHYFILKFLKTSVALNFDLSKPLKDLEDNEQILETILMNLGIYNIEKKISMLTGIKDSKEFKKIIMNNIHNLNDFVRPHIEFQNRHYASCWFVGDHIESSLMWSSYSQKGGGIAVRLRFLDFRKAIQKFFRELNKVNTGIKGVYAGLVKYMNYNDGETWISEINKRVPLPFFKQHFYKQENEFRIIVEENEKKDFTPFQSLNKVFTEDIRFRIILHPSAGPDELREIKSKVQGNKLLRVSLSGMDFNIR